jgi:hypothetical protein
VTQQLGRDFGFLFTFTRERFLSVILVQPSHLQLSNSIFGYLARLSVPFHIILEHILRKQNPKQQTTYSYHVEMACFYLRFPRNSQPNTVVSTMLKIIRI